MTNPEVAYRASSKAIEERNELVMRELPQVYYVAARIRERLPKQVEMEDLVQAGVMGQMDWGSRTLRRKGREIAASAAKLESQLGRHALEEEIAADLKMGVDELQSALAQLDGLSLVGQRANVSGDSDETFDLIESAPSVGKDNPFELCLEGEMKAQLAAAVSRMSEREQLILSLYYYEELTMKEVAEVVGIAVSRVSQIHAAAMLKLRVSLGHLREADASPLSGVPAAAQRTHAPHPRTQP
jgi:RNA polymerase sigma factor for flagellar operon FliA